jgi:hypothetical protein
MATQEEKPAGVVMPQRRIAYKWIVLSVTTIGALMAAIDSTIVVLGLPDMMLSLHSGGWRTFSAGCVCTTWDL